MKQITTLGLRIKWSAFLTAPITCTLLAGLLLTAPDRALAYTEAGSLSSDYGSIFSHLEANGTLDNADWQSGTFLKNLLGNADFKDHLDDSQVWSNYESGFTKNQHQNAILFGNHLKGLLLQENDRHYEKHHSDVVPIPASAWLFGSAIGLLGWSKRRKA
jgi:hypothetical protein